MLVTSHLAKRSTAITVSSFVRDLMDWLHHSVGSLVLKIDGIVHQDDLIRLKK